MADQPALWTDYACELGEGARWVDGRLIHVDILGGFLFTVDGSRPHTGEPEVLVDAGLPLGAVAPVADRPGTWIAAVGHGIALLTESGTEWLAEFGTPEAMRVNDAVADPGGRFWAGTLSYDNTPGAGALYRVDPDGTVVTALSDLTIPNGPAFSADGTLMYLSNSAHGSVDVYPVDPATGYLGAPDPFARLESGLTPDGLTVDDEGCVWVAVWDGSQVRRYRPDGSLDRTLSLPTSRPTSCCFGGPAMNRLFVTTAAYDLRDDAAGKVYAFDLDVTGRAADTFRPREVR
ncbi:SMP-30/gluconolactonase/LRE family protein [Stackebrandtia nassauensis]|uniref:SMP-30/gluconolactonase/LRE family protein n=1 Tax=Stackebrandtia nassauensis TaxID=283811 RepID=UPI0001A39A0B|nr:SMP-30/gluconolactonase/LRE family protein [Stackebrandtia nassauensis]